MDAQQLYNHIIKPTHHYLGGNYDNKNASFLSLCTAAVESNCGHKIKQDNGPALGIWQMEPRTEKDIWSNCDVLKYEDSRVYMAIEHLTCAPLEELNIHMLISSPLYACAMARLKYAMDIETLPRRGDLMAVYNYYKRIYNTDSGASTYEKFKNAILSNGIISVIL